MQPDQASFLLNAVFLPSVKRESHTTRAVIGAVPLDQSGYRPDTISKTALELSWHIAASEMRFIDSVIAGTFDMTPRPKPESIQTSADLVAWYSENLDSRLTQLAQVTPEQLTTVIDFRGLMQMPAVMFLNMMLHHSVHHRGQLSTYLRPMGAKVPAIYGESYDTALARKAQQTAS
jgi:uncharacterized damage-inducible protein DinB